MVEQLEKEYAGKVKVVAVDAHNNYDTASTYGIMGLPTLLLFKGGKEVSRIVGFQPKEKIADAMKKALGV